MANMIVLQGDGRAFEHNAAAALKPGHLLELDTAGKVKKHASEGGAAEKHFAKEDALQGKTIDDAYATDDVVFGHIAKAGDEINAILKDGQIAVIGSLLVSAGDGTLKLASDLPTAIPADQIIAVALVALDLSATAAVDSFLAVRVL